MKKITAILIGAGLRGATAYASYAKTHVDEIEFIGVAEPDADRRTAFKKEHNLEDNMCFSSWEEILDKPKFADAALICTQDTMHFEPTMKALEKGYHILLEKPMSTNLEECIKIGECAKKFDRVFAICHVLRYTPFFTTIKKLLDDGRIGQLISIQHNENVGYFHQAHSYVRGNWRRKDESSPMILAKSCHDMDIMLWLAGANCVSIASFGDLTYFKKENAPVGAPRRCIDGCEYEKECAFDAKRLYLGRKTEWMIEAMTNDPSDEGVEKALREGPYGRCVFQCDNDVVDHQVASIVFENGVTAAFTMCAFTKDISRTLKLMGTKGGIRAAMEQNEVEVIDFLNEKIEKIHIEAIEDSKGHGGGDQGIMKEFVSLVANNNNKNVLTSADVSVQSHIMSFAAEQSRIENKVINIKEYMSEVMNNQ
jgi:predicted dehydrogenase